MEPTSVEKKCFTCKHHSKLNALEDTPTGCWTCINADTRINWVPKLSLGDQAHLDEGEARLEPLEYAALHQAEPRITAYEVAEAQAERLEPKTALETQVAGDHYKKLKIQPMEYSMANKLDACQHTAIKYVTRFRDKGGVDDLDKAIHCIELLKQFETEGM